MAIEWGGIGLTSNMTNQLLDNNGLVTNILDADQPFTVRIAWNVPPPLAPFLGGQFRLRVYVESIGPGPEQQIGQQVVSVVGGQVNYGPVSIVVPGNALPGEGQGTPPVSGVYKLVSVLQHLNPGETEGSGFAEGPVAQLRKP